MLTILREKKLKMFLINSGLHKEYIYNIYLYIYNLETKVGDHRVGAAAVRSLIPDRFPQTVFPGRRG